MKLILNPQKRGLLKVHIYYYQDDAIPFHVLLKGDLTIIITWLFSVI